MRYEKRTYIDNMVDLFGYDYVIGYCLCSAHNLSNLAKSEPDQEKKQLMMRKASKFESDVNSLSRERFDYGL